MDYQTVPSQQAKLVSINYLVTVVHYKKIIEKLVLLYELKRDRWTLLGSSICTPINLRAIVGVFWKVWMRKYKIHKIYKGDLDTQIKKDYHRLEQDHVIFCTTP